jgi:putative DNA primase/helicase
MGIPINYKKSRNVGASATATPSDEERSHLDATLLPYADQLLAEWCAEIEIHGPEIVMRNPLRADESLGSFKFNTKNGGWSDFAVQGFAGFGLTTLYVALKGGTLNEALTVLRGLAEDASRIPHRSSATPKRDRPKVEVVNPDDVRLPPDLHPDLGAPTVQWEYRDSEGRLSFYVYRFEQDGKKETRPLAWSGAKDAWSWQYPSTPYPLYRLPDLLGRPEATVIISEGEKATDAAARQFVDAVAITSACGSEQALRSDWSHLKGRTVFIAPDKDAPGKHYALSVAGAALAHGASVVKVIDVWQLPGWSTGDDLADHEVGVEFLGAAVEVSDLFEQIELEPHIVRAAAGLGRGDFDRCKRSLADRLSIGVRTIEGLVKEARPKESDTETDGDLFEDDTLEPWNEPVAGEALFSEITALVGRHVILTDSQAVAVACWIVFSYGFETMRICPQILINSPSKRCGKSTLLELIMGLVHRPLPAANISSAAIFRSIEAWKPTLLIDEADTFLNSKSNEEITGILNSGHNRSLAYVVRTQEVDGEHMPVRFSTFCPKVIAMIKAPVDTIIDRSIVITLVRKLSTQRIDPLAIDAADRMKDTRRRLLRWVADNIDAVQYDVETVPTMANDRARQNWAVLAAFAQTLGSVAHTALLKAAEDLADTSTIEEDIETDLLTDIRELVREEKKNHVQSAVLVKELLKMKERPWGEINRGKEMTENKLARLLKPFKIMPEKFRDGGVTHRGYGIAVLNSVFDRYLGASV